ncbi:MAG TPA: hypothetical protein VFQ65_21745, partial [Kofleriaceae bacterium]|nr:hypothetical protein [Kofleriaceae bacterium]
DHGAVWVGAEVDTNATDLSQPSVKGEALAEPARGKVAAQLASAPGAHDQKCDATDAKQGKVLDATLELTDEPKVRAVASLKDGVAIVDPGGVVIARSAPLGCTGPGASQDELSTFAWLVVPRGLGVDTPHHPPNPQSALQMLAVTYTNGGRRDWQTNVAVFARRDKTLVKVFEGLVASSDANGAGHVWQSALGNLVHSGPGETKKRAFRWDRAKFTFTALP